MSGMLMRRFLIGLVVVQILVVWAWGVEPRNRGLEDVATAKAR